MVLEKFSEEVHHQIEKILMITDRINNYSGKVPSIEIDLAMEEIRRLYDVYALFRSIVEGGDYREVADMEKASEAAPEIKTQQVEVPEVIPEMGNEIDEVIEAGYPEIEVEVEVEVEAKVKQKVDPEIKPEDDTEVQPQVDTQKKIEPETTGMQSKTEEVKEKGKQGAILADKLTRSGQKSINDLIAAGRHDESISSRMQHNPISNLKSAIGINEKFIFVYELFSGNNQQYSEVIDRLNNMPGREEAISLMESLRAEFRWDIENMAFQMLVDMVARRYSK